MNENYSLPIHYIVLGEVFTGCGKSLIEISRSHASTQRTTCPACLVSDDYLAQVMEQVLKDPNVVPFTYREIPLDEFSAPANSTPVTVISSTPRGS